MNKLVLHRADIRALHAATGRLHDESEFGEKFKGGTAAQVRTIVRLVKKMRLLEAKT